MIWLSKEFPFGAQWAADQDRFVEVMQLIAANGTNDYAQVLMVLNDDDRFTTDNVFLRLPGAYRHFFPAYEKSEAPARAQSLLVGNQTEFHRLFPEDANQPA